MKHLLKYYPQIWNNWEQIILICKIFKKTTICFPPKQKPQIRSNNFPDYSNKAFQRSSTPSILPFNPFLNSTDSALFVPLLQMVQHHSGVHPSIHPFPQKKLQRSDMNWLLLPAQKPVRKLNYGANNRQFVTLLTVRIFLLWTHTFFFFWALSHTLHGAVCFCFFVEDFFLLGKKICVKVFVLGKPKASP